MTAREMSACKPSIIDLPKRGILTSSVGSAKVGDNIKLSFGERSIYNGGGSFETNIFAVVSWIPTIEGANMGLGGLKKCKAYFMHLIWGFRFDGAGFDSSSD